MFWDWGDIMSSDKCEILFCKPLLISMLWFLVLGSNQHRVHLLTSGFPLWNQLVAVINRADNEHRRLRIHDSGPGFRIGHLLSPRGPAFSWTRTRVGWGGQWLSVGFVLWKITETDSQILGLSELPLSLTYTGHSWPQASTLKTVDLFFLSLQCHLKKEKNPTPSALPPCVLPPSHALLLRCLIRSLSGRPNRITSAARSTDSFLSTPALSGCSAGVSEILARCGGPARGRLPPTQRWVPGFFRRARHVWTWLKLQHQKLQLLHASRAWARPSWTCNAVFVIRGLNEGRTLKWRKCAGCWQPERQVNPCFVCKAKFG